MKIFVTGASGFVGGAFTSAAVKAGHSVVAMARSEKSEQAAAARGATPRRCELGRVSAEHLAGCDVIVHSAAFVEQWGSRAEFYAGNVEGTVQLLRVARQSSVCVKKTATRSRRFSRSKDWQKCQKCRRAI